MGLGWGEVTWLQGGAEAEEGAGASPPAPACLPGGCLSPRSPCAFLLPLLLLNQHTCLTSGCTRDSLLPCPFVSAYPDADIAAALEVERLSADEPVRMLSSDPDRFFGRTTRVGRGAGRRRVGGWGWLAIACAHCRGCRPQ